MPKIKAASVDIGNDRVLKLGSITSAYRHIFVIGGDVQGYLSFSITYMSGTYSVYGNRNGMRIYYVTNTLYMMVPNGHQVRPIAWNIGSNNSDTLDMVVFDNLPSGAVECNYAQ